MGAVRRFIVDEYFYPFKTMGYGTTGVVGNLTTIVGNDVNRRGKCGANNWA